MEKTRLSPLTDITTIVSIESLFNHNYLDPDGIENAGYFADMYIWSDDIRYVLPVPKIGDHPYIPELINKLTPYNSKIISAHQYYCDEANVVLDNYYLEESFSNFYAFIRTNSEWFKKWLKPHNEKPIQIGHQAWIGELFYEYDKLETLPMFTKAMEVMQLTKEQLFYAFDVSLRYCFYGEEFVGEDEYYLTHRIRYGVNYPTKKTEECPAPKVPISFCKTMPYLIRNMNMSDYVIFLHETRGLLEEEGIRKMNIKSVEKKYLRELAQKLELPPHIKTPQFIQLLFGFTGLKGKSTSISQLFSKTRLPRAASRIKWLNWLYHWDIEEDSMSEE